MKTPKLSLRTALIPVFFLIFLLTFNVIFYGDYAIKGSSQFILLISAAMTGLIGYRNKVSFKTMFQKIQENITSVKIPILILLSVGALAGTWLISGIIPAMIYYGIQIANPDFFLPTCVLICTIVSLSTGSSWSTSATVGISLIGIGKVLGIPTGIIAGAVISGSYFGDKLSPLSDTTNLASAISGSELFKHIRYMLYTTLPTITITLIVFLVLGLTFSTSGDLDTTTFKNAIKEKFNINILLFIAPLTVMVMIIKKKSPLISLFVGTILGVFFAIIFQPNLLIELAEGQTMNIKVACISIIKAITIDTSVPTSNELLNELFFSGGMKGMLDTIFLIICAMVFGGIMDAIGALQTISNAFLNWAKSTFQLFASTAASCLTVNLSASDQYLAIVVPGKMFKNAYKDRRLASENLSRTLEDSGTVTSVLIPWNTCGAYQSSVLNVSVTDYFIYAVFNWLSPLITLIYAYFKIKIRYQHSN